MKIIIIIITIIIIIIIKESQTLTGFLRSTTKFSARCIMKRVNLWQRIFSISSACLILMLKRMELMELSMRTFSFSLRLMIRGVRRTSLLALQTQAANTGA